MTRATKMMLLNSGKDKRKIGFEYEWEPRDHYSSYGPYMPPTYNMPVEDAFYDRRGRRHYDNGRFAPMSVYGSPENRRSGGRRGSGARSEYDGGYMEDTYMPMEPWGEGGSDGYMERGGQGGRSGRSGSSGGRGSRSGFGGGARSWGGNSPRMIGFGRDWGGEEMRSDATMPHMMEFDQLRGQRSQGGMAYSEELPEFDQRMAMEWVHNMKNADGSRGPHWSLEKTKELQKQYNIDCDPYEFWAVINSLYSDYCEALKKNNASTVETYACLAKAWIEDEDAVKAKAAAYFEYIVKH